MMTKRIFAESVPLLPSLTSVQKNPCRYTGETNHIRFHPRLNLPLVVAIGPVLLATITCSVVAIEPALKVAPGFTVQHLYAVPLESQGSWISLAADRRGILYASDQYGPLYRIQLASDGAAVASVQPVKLPIGGIHSLTHVGDDLYAVVGEREISPPGLYRLRDANQDSELDYLDQLQSLPASGEHGPHAVMPSADGKSLYVLAGNATPLPPLKRSRVPSLARGNSALPPLPAVMGSETRGLPHGGWICRTDLEGREWELLCCGIRNAYSFAASPNGELFAADSDTEFELNLPWYRPNRVLHCISGADFGWRSGALKIPDDSAQSLPPVIEIGPGSPTAVFFSTGTNFPPPYNTALFVADWSFGRLLAIHLKPSGASFTAEREEILSGTPLPIAAACVNPRDQALYFVTGGRKVQSHLYRLLLK